MAFDGLTLNSGTGGGTLAIDSFVDTDLVTRLMPYGAVAFGAINGPYVGVTPTVGLPVRLADGSGYIATLPVSIAAAVAVTGTFYQATQPVSIASTVTVTGAGGTFPVTDSGGSLTVDAPVGTPVFVRLSDGSAAITTLPVSVATVPSHDVTNAGTFAVQAAQSGTWNVTNVSGTVSLPTGAATAARQDTGNTSLSSIDGKITAVNTGAVVLAAGTAAFGKLAANSGVDIGDVDVTSQPARVATTDTITAKLATDAIQNGTTALTPKFVAIAASSSGNNTLLAAVTSKKIRVLAYNLMGAGAVNAKFQSGAGGTDLTGLKYIAAAGGGICAPFNPVGWMETASGVLLNLNLSGAVAVGGELVYVEV